MLCSNYAVKKCLIGHGMTVSQIASGENLCRKLVKAVEYVLQCEY